MNFKSNKRKCTFLNLRKYFPLVLVLCLWGISPQSKAQSNSSGSSKTVKGIVFDELKEPLVGVNVREKGTNNRTITDSNGRFQFKVASGAAKLSFSYMGYISMDIVIGTGDLSIQLSPDSKQIDEFVVVGYANQNKKSVVGAIAQTSGESLKSKGAVSNLTDALSGSIPGVTVMSRSGAPGSSGIHSAAPEILIRGLATWNNAQPLILVDGVERSMNDINIDEIENISVLKDASATAVFGVKGANGVILITSKRGTIGKAKVSAEVNLSLKSISHVEKPVGSYGALLAEDYAILNEFPLSDATQMGNFTPTRVLEYYRDHVQPDRYTDVDWQKVMLRDQAVSAKYNVNASGGTEFVKYFTSLAYLSDGDIMNTGIANPRGYKNEFSYDRINFRTNLDFTLTKTTAFKVNLSGYYGRQQEPNRFANSFWSGIYKYIPNSPLPIYSDGLYGADDPRLVTSTGANTLYILQTGGTSVNKRTAITSDFELEQKLDFFTKGLSVKGRFSFDNYFSSTGSNIQDPSDYVRKRYNYDTQQWNYIIPLAGTDGFDFQPQPLGYTKETTNSSATSRNIYYELATNYKRSFGKHNVSALALFSRQEFATGSAWPSKREDWVGRLTYDYEGKYLFESNAAYNGSEKFGPDFKFAFFPSFAIGWRLSEEPFIKKNVPQLSNLKLRYSIGWVGNDNVAGSAWGYLTSWNPYTTTFVKATETKEPAFGSAVGGVSSIYVKNSFQEGAIGNPSLHWESARKQNTGVEFGLWNDLITGTVDYFNDYRYEMLIPSEQRKAIPDFYGQVASSVNAGEVKMSGWEIELKARKKIGNVNLWGAYTWTVAKSLVLNMEDPMLLPSYMKREGFRINQITTSVASDFITSWDDLYTGVMSESNTSRKQVLPGSIRSIDYNANGVNDAKDVVPWGYARQPQNTYGFSLGGDYKGFSVMMQFYGTYNTTVDGLWVNEEFFRQLPIVYDYQLSKTATPEYGVNNPSYRSLGFVNSQGLSNYSKIDASILRLKTAEISYTVPKKLLKSLSLENVRIFVNGNNLLFWSKLPIDLEAQDFRDNATYPNTKNINFGMNVTL